MKHWGALVKDWLMWIWRLKSSIICCLHLGALERQWCSSSVNRKAWEAGESVVQILVWNWRLRTTSTDAPGQGKMEDPVQAKCEPFFPLSFCSVKTLEGLDDAISIGVVIFTQRTSYNTEGVIETPSQTHSGIIFCHLSGYPVGQSSWDKLNHHHQEVWNLLPKYLL